jgi:hypothetical protein
MFTGFASENTPAIQVWDFFRTFASISAARSVSLADDCAAIQVFRTGATSTSNIRVYLPTAPIEGKQITIINQHFGINSQNIEIYSSDVSGAGSSLPILSLGPSSSIVLVYSKQAISYGPNAGINATGWITLNQGSPSSASFASAIVGGDANKINNAYGFIGGGSGNTVSANNSVILGGSSSIASGSNSAVVGGSSNTANGQNAGILSGNSSVASGINAVVLGGDTNTANAFNSAVVSGAYGTTRNITGIQVSPASRNPIAGFSGVQQSSVLIVGRQTTNATATRLASDTGSADTTNQVILPNNSAYYVKGSIIATVTGGGNTKSWDFIATIKRGANAAATSIVGAVTLNVQAADAGAATWIVAITADTTNGGLAVTVTGQAATTIRWVAKLESTEVTY